MAQIRPHTHTSPLYIGSFDDNMLCHGPQFVKPIDTSFITAQISSAPKRPSLTTSPPPPPPPHELFDDDSSAVLGDDDDYTDDELPPSPIRRHSGAISISQEDLPFCYDRAALRRETAAHRAQQHHAQRSHHMQAVQPKRARAGPSCVSDIDGPSMSLWVPDEEPAAGASSTEIPPQHHVRHIEGPMMSLWEA